MDIAGLSMALSTSQLQQSVSVAVLDMAMDSNTSLANNLTAMLDASQLEQSVTPHIGANLDVMV